MTTIAFDGVNLAADGRVTQADSILQEDFVKITEDKKYFYAGAGSVNELEKFLRGKNKKSIVVKKQKKKSSKKTSDGDDLDIDLPAVHLIRVSKKSKQAEYSDDGVWWSKIPSPYSLGTGSTAAKAAMLAGASASEAVDIAHQIDVYTGPCHLSFKV